MSKRRPLLGRLSELGWITQMGEPTATKAVDIMLEEPALKAAILDRLAELASVDLSSVTWFVSEAVADDRARPDLEGRDDEGRPVLVVEMKFNAWLGADQIFAYMRNQATKLNADQPRAIVALVPKSRLAEAQRAIDQAGATWDADGRQTRPGFAVISWDDWLDTWSEAAQDLPDGPESVTADLAQLRAMCATLGSTVIPALGDVARGDGWRERSEDLKEIANQISKALTRPGSRLLPTGDEPYQDFYGRRYVYLGKVYLDSLEMAVGVVGRFADAGQSPLWVRFLSSMKDFPIVRERILGSRFGAISRSDFGHLWVPLVAPPESTGVELIETLTNQAREMVAVATEAPLGTRETWADAAHELLVEVAGHYHSVITYSALGDAIQQRTGIATRMGIQNWIGPVLELVVQRCAREGTPPLTSLVVRKDTGMVGDGYDAVLRAAAIPPLEETMQREEHAARSRLECYQWTGAPDLPINGGEPAFAPRLAEAIARKERDAHPKRELQICPTCHMTLPLSGVCDNCG